MSRLQGGPQQVGLSGLGMHGPPGPPGQQQPRSQPPLSVVPPPTAQVNSQMRCYPCTFSERLLYIVDWYPGLVYPGLICPGLYSGFIQGCIHPVLYIQGYIFSQIYPGFDISRVCRVGIHRVGISRVDSLGWNVRTSRIVQETWYYSGNFWWN
jgi:hypothetical protein